jgi:Tfp pilus assembly protein PilN
VVLWGVVNLIHGQVERAAGALRIEMEHPSQLELLYQELRMQRNQVEQRSKHLVELAALFADRHWRDVVETVRACVPAELWLTGARYSNDHKFSIDGVAFDESLIYEFREHLEGSPLFDQATIVTTTSSNRANLLVVEFSLECRLRAPETVNEGSEG